MTRANVSGYKYNAYSAKESSTLNYWASGTLTRTLGASLCLAEFIDPLEVRFDFRQDRLLLVLAQAFLL